MEAVLEDEVVTAKLYSCIVRPGGNLLHSVPFSGITDREVRVLRSIHGNDCVTELRQIGNKDIDVREHLNELAVKYTVARVEKAFGVSLDNFAEWLEQREQAREDRRHQAAIENAQVAAQPAKVAAVEQPQQPVPPPAGQASRARARME